MEAEQWPLLLLLLLLLPATALGDGAGGVLTPLVIMTC